MSFWSPPKTRSKWASYTESTVVNGRASVVSVINKKMCILQKWKTGPSFQCQTEWTERELSFESSPKVSGKLKVDHWRQNILKKRWSMEHADHRRVIVDTPNCFSEKVRYWQYSQLRKVIFLPHRDCICDYHLLEQTSGQPLNCRWTVKKHRFIIRISAAHKKNTFCVKKFSRDSNSSM